MAVVQQSPIVVPLTGAGGPTLAGGARYAAAASPLPARVTTEADTVIDLSAVGRIQGFIFSEADDGVICVFNALGVTRKYNFSGTQIWTATTTNGWAPYRRSATEFAVSRSNSVANYWSLDESGTVTAKTGLTSAANKQIIKVIGGTSGKSWRVVLGSSVTEFDETTGADVGGGRAIAATVLAAWGGTRAGVPSLFVLTSGLVTQYKESDLTTVTAFVANGASPSPGGAFGSCLVVDPSGLPVVWTPSGDIDRLSVAATNQVGVADRYIHSGPESRGPGCFTSGSNLQQAGFIDWTADGRYVAFLAPSPDQTLDNRLIRIVNIQAQTSQWDVTVPAGSTQVLTRINVAGATGHLYGVTDAAYRSGTTRDHRRITWTYQRRDSGTTDASPVAFEPNDTLSVSLTAGQTLRIVATFTADILRPYEEAPYIAGLTIDRTAVETGTAYDPFVAISTNLNATIAHGSTTTTVVLGAVADDAGGSIASYLWTVEYDGGAIPGADFDDDTAQYPYLLNASAGYYSIRCTVTDNDSNTAYSEVTVTVTAAAADPRVAVADLDRTIVLPTSTTTFEAAGVGVSFETYAWMQLSGPLTATLAGEATDTLVVTDATTAGDYVFRVTMTYNGGNSTATADVTLTVLSDPNDVDQSTLPDATGTTTITAIRDHYFALLRAATPASHTDRHFDHVSQVQVQDWAKGAATIEHFRKFEWRGGAAEEGDLVAYNQVERIESVALTVYYPVLPEFYGRDGVDDLEEVIRRDARTIRDLLYAPSNYITGLQLCEVAIGQPQRSGAYYVMTLALSVHYYEAESLYR